MLKFILCLAMAICDGEKTNTGILVDRVDVIEINHFVNDEGVSQLDQIIFYKWSKNLDKYVVIAWRSIKSSNQLPFKYKDGYLAVWTDSRDGNVQRKVYAKSVRETWTNYDPETVNQEFLDRNARPELKQKRRTKLLPNIPPHIFP